MNQPSRTSQAPETEDEYRAIEAALGYALGAALVHADDLVVMGFSAN